MRRSLSVRIATLLLVASMAAPAFAARREDSPVDPFDRAMSRIVKVIRHLIPFDLINAQPPKP